jgi:hypothetical protein
MVTRNLPGLPQTTHSTCPVDATRLQSQFTTDMRGRLSLNLRNTGGGGGLSGGGGLNLTWCDANALGLRRSASRPQKV